MVNKNANHNPNSQLPTLPDHILFEEILPRLPVKSLIRYKSVSKHFLSTISSHKFQQTHLQLYSSTPQLLIFQGDYIDSSNSPPTYHLSCHESTTNFKPFLKMDPLLKPHDHHSSPREWSSTYAIGSCNGIVCLFDEYFDFYLWNPATRQSYDVCTCPDVLIDRIYGFGFGYVSSIDDYRIGCVQYSYEDDEDEDFIHVCIFSLRSMQWKRTRSGENGDHIVDCPELPLLFDDTLYWPPYVSFGNQIVGLNLVSGQLKILNLPVDCMGTAKVFKMKGCLSLCYGSGIGASDVYDVWMLKQSDDCSSWEKVFSLNLGYLDLVHLFDTGKCLVRGEGERLMLLDPSEIAVGKRYEKGIDSEREGSEDEDIDSEQEGIYFPHSIDCAWGYVESLISPFGTTIVSETEDAEETRG